ncbi:MAG: methyltransferase domain-containing protein [Myxococcota bacterium]
MQTSRFGRELIVDETFASLHRPGEIATLNVWDAIAAPLLALPESRRKRVLLLGLGGGSVARIIRALAPGALIVGVEFDSEVVAAARAHFGLGALRLEVIVADALDVLRRERRRFDLVVEDLFVGHGDAVRKPDWIPAPGLDLAERLLRPGGLLVSNNLDEARRVGVHLRARFPGLLSLEVDDYENRVFVAGPARLDARTLRAAVARDPVLGESVETMHFRDARRR